MAKGRPDYNIKVVPVAEVLGDDEDEYIQTVWSAVPAETHQDICVITVPGTYDLYLTSIILTPWSAYNSELYIRVQTNYVVWVVFDSQFVCPYSGAASVRAQAGETITFNVFNADDVPNQYYLSIRGYKKYI